jgi:hypothetical protein
MKIVMDDGTEDEIGPGDTSIIPPGHKAWVVGNERYVSIDFTGLMDYQRRVRNLFIHALFYIGPVMKDEMAVVLGKQQ